MWKKFFSSLKSFDDHLKAIESKNDRPILFFSQSELENFTINEIYIIYLKDNWKFTELLKNLQCLLLFIKTTELRFFKVRYYTTQ